MVESTKPVHCYEQGIYSIWFLDEMIDWQNQYVMDDFGNLVCVHHGN